MTADFKRRGNPLEAIESNLDDLLGEWGLGLGDKLIGSREQGTITIESTSRGMYMSRTVPMPFMVRTGDANFDLTSPILRGVRDMTLPWCFPVTIDEEMLKANGLTYTELVRTNKDVWFRPATPFLTQQMLRIPRDEFEGKQTVAVLVQGKFPFAYQGRELPPWPKPEDAGSAENADAPPVIRPPSQPVAEEEEKADPAANEAVEISDEPADTESVAPDSPVEGGEPQPEPDQERKEEKPKKEMVPPIQSRPGNLLLVGSSDIINVDYIKKREYQPNILFFNNAVEVFSLGEELIDIRAKTVIERSLEETTEGQRTFYKVFNIVTVPILLIGFGLIRYLIRRRQEATSI
jgi:hypothetical protein